ncbi:MAG: hypothetical protein KME04_17130 [Pleurocapsa minor GSE-CHR-MK-17-07R]|jgi:hypothetical protein|nr:hypothetical protein [Pleurocapsa minor GSE-CHR-MK 17-07R]
MGYVDTPVRAIRHFNVYMGERVVLSAEDTPGRLYSVASPPPGGAPPHPFVNARAYDAFSEGDLATILWNAADFDDFLVQLIAEGMNTASWNDSSAAPRIAPRRLFRGDALVGAVWESAGQFTALTHQPPYDALVFSHAMLTAYAISEADTLLRLVQETSAFSELSQRLQDAGYTLQTAGG